MLIDLRRIVVRMENEQGLEIKGLFDAFQVNKEASTKAHHRITMLERRFEKHERKVK
jgi:hypothetical protein